MMNITCNLREHVQQLAEAAFERRLISGYGDGERTDEFQLVINGKPRHVSLAVAQNYLESLITIS